MVYEAPAGNITNTGTVFYWIAGVTNSWFFPGLILAVYVIILARLIYKTNNLGQAFSAASFICMVMTVLLRVAGLVSTQFMIIFIILTAVGAVWMHLENSRYG